MAHVFDDDHGERVGAADCEDEKLELNGRECGRVLEHERAEVEVEPQRVQARNVVMKPKVP